MMDALARLMSNLGGPGNSVTQNVCGRRRVSCTALRCGRVHDGGQCQTGPVGMV